MKTLLLHTHVLASTPTRSNVHRTLAVPELTTRDVSSSGVENGGLKKSLRNIFKKNLNNYARHLNLYLKQNF